MSLRVGQKVAGNGDGYWVVDDVHGRVALLLWEGTYTAPKTGWELRKSFIRRGEEIHMKKRSWEGK